MGAVDLAVDIGCRPWLHVKRETLEPVTMGHVQGHGVMRLQKSIRQPTDSLSNSQEVNRCLLLYVWRSYCCGRSPDRTLELVHSSVKASFVDPSSVGLVEISPLHHSRLPIGRWMACVQITINGQPTLYLPSSKAHHQM